MAPFVSRYIFQDGGIRTSTSYGGRSFIHCFVERVERLRMFIHNVRARVKVLYCFVWNYREPRNMYLLATAMNLLLCDFLLFMLCWARYHTDLEQMLKRKRQNICHNRHWMSENSCNVLGLQPEGAHYHHSETVINFIRQLLWKRGDSNNTVLALICSCKIPNTVAFYLSFFWDFIGCVKLTLKSDWLFYFTVPVTKNYCVTWNIRVYMLICSRSFVYI